MDLGTHSSVDLLLTVTALSGTSPTLTVTVEHSSNADGPWASAGAFSAVSAIGETTKTFTGLKRFVRAKWVLGGSGTPTVTASLAGTSVLVYATPAQFRELGIPASGASGKTDAELDKLLRAATGIANSYLRVSMSLPLVAWSLDLTERVCSLAAWSMLSVRGFNPENPGDAVYRFKYEDAIRWFEKIAGNKARPDGAIDQTLEADDGGGYVVSKPRRAWSG